MRIAVLVIGLMLSVGLFIQSALVNGLSKAAGNNANVSSGAVGVMMALMWIIACALVIPVPRVAMVLFLLAAIVGFAAAAGSSYSDLYFWVVMSALLALFSYFGFRGKRTQQAKEAEHDALLRQAIAGRVAPPAPVSASRANANRFCPECGAANAATARFCQACGMNLGS